jgi:uncharacterized membrane protein YsdA (DUF1294 family)
VLLEKFLIGYLLFINLLSSALLFHDKRAAKRNKQRIRERTFFILAILGGSLGIFFSMLIFHHKTKKLKFMIGIPFILILQLIIGFWVEKSANPSFPF